MKKYTNVIIILLVVMTLYTIMVVAVSKNENKNKDKDKDSQNNPTNPNNPNNPNDPNQGGSDPKEDNKSVSYIIMSPNTIISYSNGKWSEKKNYDYVNKQFDVYDETGKLGNYQLQKSNDKWHVKDASNNFIDYTGNLFAITGDYEYNNIDYLKEDLKESDEQNIRSYLDSKGITYDYNEISKTKIVIDINNDGIREDLYAITNAFTDSPDLFNKVFSVVFVKSISNTASIYENIMEIEKSYQSCVPYISNIISINNEKNVILGCTHFSDNGTEHIVYKILDNKYILQLKTSINSI